MITEYKTKKEVVYDSINNKKDILYIGINNIIFSGTAYQADVNYVKKNIDEVSGQATGSEQVYYSNTVFSVEEANYLETALNVTGNTIAERLIDLAMKTLPMQIEKLGLLGLKASDLELVVEEVSPEEIIQEEVTEETND